MAAWRYKISLLVLKKYFTRSLRSSLMKFFSTLEEKFRFSARPCNILYILRTGSLWQGSTVQDQKAMGFENHTRHTFVFEFCWGILPLACCLKCFLSEDGSVYLFGQPGTWHAYGFCKWQKNYIMSQYSKRATYLNFLQPLSQGSQTLKRDHSNQTT